MHGESCRYAHSKSDLWTWAPAEHDAAPAGPDDQPEDPSTGASGAPRQVYEVPALEDVPEDDVDDDDCIDQ